MGMPSRGVHPCLCDPGRHVVAVVLGLPRCPGEGAPVAGGVMLLPLSISGLHLSLRLAAGARLSAAVLPTPCVGPTPTWGTLRPLPAAEPTSPWPCRAGPSAPLSWVRACVQVLDPKSKWRSKILLGLNFYGMDYSVSKDTREPVIGAR